MSRTHTPVPSLNNEPTLTPVPSAANDMPTETPPESTIKTGQHPYFSDKADRNYLLFLPDTYGEDPQQQWPLILFLHSWGVRNEDVNYIRLDALPNILEFKLDFPFIVVSPQLTNESGEEYWTGDKVVDFVFLLLEDIQENYSVDPKRIYMTGTSLGANGTWEIGLSYPDRFAALVPVMGFIGNTASVEVPENICDLKDVPIWAFHGAKDRIVPLFAEEELVNALKACGGNVRFTIYPDGDHDVGGQAYTNTELYDWLQKQSLR